MTAFSPISIPCLESERLILREWRETDLDFLDEIFSDEETARYIGGARPRWQTWRLMATYIGHWHLRGFGFWVIEEKSSGEAAGFCGLWAPERWPENEVGYSLRTGFRGKGYVTEAAIRSLVYAYDELKWPTAISFIDRKNTPSKRVAERLGARFESEELLFDEMPAEIWRHLPPKEFMERFA